MKRKDYYVYPAVLSYEEGQEIAVTFSDLVGCATSGETEAAAIACAKEALSLHLYGMEQDNEEPPTPSSIAEIQKDLEPGECIVMIEVFMPSIRMSQANKSVNRTVTLPAWLNNRALECGINFSAVLQDALKQQLNMH